MKVLIAGGGIGGLVAALNFKKRGAEVHLIEQSHDVRALGAGIQVSPNGVHVLAFLGLDKELERVGIEPLAFALRHYRTGAPYLTAPMKNVYESRYGARYFHVLRSELLALLCGAAEREGVHFHLGQRALSFEQSEKSVVLKTEQGESYEGDLLVGADGLHSRIQAQMLGEQAPRFTGQVAWRGLVRAGAVARVSVPLGANVWLGRGRHFVAYHVGGVGGLINFVAVENRSQEKSESWRHAGKIEDVRAAFAGWDRAIESLLSAAEGCFLQGLFDRAPLGRWVEGRVVLLGDAAHPMLPFMAQGASLAMEDGYVLAERVAAGAAESPLAALKQYESERLPRATMLQALSRANGALFHGRGVGGFMRVRIASFLPFLARARLDRVYGFNVRD